MQNPRKEIEDVTRGLVEKPTLARQEAILRKYFTEDVTFFHYFVNTTGGLKDLIAMYNIGEILFAYQGVEFQHIVYDYKENAIVLHMEVFIKPFHFLPIVGLKFLCHLELADVVDEDGKTVKKIRVQRDYFQRSPLMVMMPGFGRLYDNGWLRTTAGNLEAATFLFLKEGWDVVFGGLKQEQPYKKPVWTEN